MFCEVTVVKLVALFLKNTYDGVCLEEFFSKTYAFPERLSQLLINKRNTWWRSVDSHFVLFKIITLSFFFIVNIEKLKLEWKNKHRTKCTAEITTPNKNMFVFLGFVKSITTEKTTNRPPSNYWPTHWLLTQRLAESTMIFDRLDNRNIFILQIRNIAGKTYNYTSVYYLKSLLVSIKHWQRSQLYLFF